MGGNVFRDAFGSPTTSMIRRENVKKTLDHFNEAYLRPFGIREYKTLGSTGKRVLSGDLDIVVGSGDLPPKHFKNELFEYLSRYMGPEQIKKVGSNLCVRYPVQGSQLDDFVQIDLMVNPDPESTSWLMSGTGDGVKGVFRNLLLNLIAKIRGSELSIEEGEPIKISLAWPGGMLIKRSEVPIYDTRITDPQTILDTLGLDTTPVEIPNFEALVQFMSDDVRLRKVLPHFSNSIDGPGGLDYISDYEESMPDESERAIDYINESLLRTS